MNAAATAFLRGLAVPAGRDTVPRFVDGWLDQDGVRRPYLAYTLPDSVNWSEDLDGLVAAEDGSFFLDVWTRAAAIEVLRRHSPTAEPVLLDLGCSAGFLLRELGTVWPDATLAGIDAAPYGLERAHVAAPSAALFLGSATELPFGDSTVDAIFALNVFEHVGDDSAALSEMCRVLRRGGAAIVVVPFNPRLYDFYDASHRHERRYAGDELTHRARLAGFEVRLVTHLAAAIYPAFWLVKTRNRRRYSDVSEAEARALVGRSVERTRGSWIGNFTMRVEHMLLKRGRRLPFGIRELAYLVRA